MAVTNSDETSAGQEAISRYLEEELHAAEEEYRELCRKGQALLGHAIVGCWRGQSVENHLLWLAELQRQGYHGGAFPTPFYDFDAEDNAHLGEADYERLEQDWLEEFRRDWESWFAKRDRLRSEVARFR